MISCFYQHSISIEPVDHSHEIIFQLILLNRFLLHYLIPFIEVFILFNVQLNIKRLEKQNSIICSYSIIILNSTDIIFLANSICDDNRNHQRNVNRTREKEILLGDYIRPVIKTSFISSKRRRVFVVINLLSISISEMINSIIIIIILLFRLSILPIT